ncbi:HlyD family type I secretion periplasmic adaptor subunit [Endozoicomonas sp. OPT23]|uniref:HlyD family type I secretion periplasmic adaptor subunit n=1 Tax=Endozoicomonas sp. OPT23 TaxID=2072845 RepID=UPI00129A4512|nr:HlyD family type I secretion periplasmic adaptor subunit [Endozoicomonas sp. OPT23]MRI34817.1 HlyD family type I secretion periplasmic adaptor subunit [Endozoicomonas sp. OPT23]
MKALSEQLKQFRKRWKAYQQHHLSLDFMPDTSAALLMQPTGGGRLLIYLISLTVLVFFVWAGFAAIDEIARGDGKVIPSSRVQIIQNLEGGIVTDILVEEGQLVEQNQPLLRLDNTRFLSVKREAELELQALMVTSCRLKAEISGQPLEFNEDIRQFRSQIEREIDLYNNRDEVLNSELKIAKEKIRQSQQELNEMSSRIEFLGKSVALARKELKLTTALNKQGAVSEVELIRQQHRENDLAGDVQAAKLAIPRLRSALEAAQQAASEVTLNFRSQAMEEFKQNQLRISQLEEAITSHSDRVDRTLVRSPMIGRVKKIHHNTLGGVVQPGMDLMEIVPVQDQLLIEVRVRPKDIAFLKTGLAAIVKVTAYDFAIYGSLKGQVEHISADSIQDENGQSFYIVRVRTEKSHLDANAQSLPIIPGMQTSVDILTGRKTVLSYLLKPIIRARQNALREA